MPNTPDPLPGDWTTHQYDSFLIREKELNKQTQGVGSALQSTLEVTDFPDSSIDSTSIAAGPLVGDFRITDGSISSRDYKKLGTGWSIDSDGTTHGFTSAKCANIVLYGSTTNVSTGDGLYGIAIPAELNGTNLTAALASVYTKGATNTTDIQIRRRRAGTSADMLSTKITIGDEYYAADGTIDTTKDDVATGDLIFADVDAVQTTRPKGLSIVLTFE